MKSRPGEVTGILSGLKRKEKFKENGVGAGLIFLPQRPCRPNSLKNAETGRIYDEHVWEKSGGIIKRSPMLGKLKNIE